MKEERASFLIRMRAGLKARIEELARLEHRSTNQQIEYLLERAIEGHAGEVGSSADTEPKPRTKSRRS